jgi:SHS family lactate transporter-like MFS transporter
MILLAVWMGWVLDAFDFTLFLLVMPSVAKTFHATLTATSLIVTLTLLTRLLGGLAAGAAADRWGRRLPLLLSIVWFSVCDGAVALTPSFLGVLVLRTLFGLGMGAEWTAGSALVMEAWPERARGLASGLLQGGWAVGYFLAGAVYPAVDSRWGWRGMFALAALPALLVVPLRFIVPKGEVDPPATPDAIPERYPVAARATTPPGHGRTPGLWTMVRAERLGGQVLFACGVLSLGFVMYNALTVHYPTLLTQQLGFSPAEVGRQVRLFNLGMLVGTGLAGAWATRLGVYRVLSVLSLALLPAIPCYLGLWGADPSTLRAGALAVGLVGAGTAGVTPLLLTELFPAPIRGRLMGLSYHVGAALAALTPTLIAAHTERVGVTRLPWAMGTVAGIAALGVAALCITARKALGVAVQNPRGI